MYVVVVGVMCSNSLISMSLQCLGKGSWWSITTDPVTLAFGWLKDIERLLMLIRNAVAGFRGEKTVRDKQYWEIIFRTEIQL